MKKLFSLLLSLALATQLVAGRPSGQFMTLHGTSGQAVVQGFVYDAYTSLGLEGVTIAAADYNTTTLADGSYILIVDEGNYDLFFMKEGWITNIIPSLLMIDTLNIDATLHRQPLAFPFAEDWSSGSFETNFWSFEPEQGNWQINDTIGNPEPSVIFVGDTLTTEYSFSLISYEIDISSATNYIFLEFDLILLGSDFTSDEKLAVEIWNGEVWVLIAEFLNTSNLSWQKFQYDVTDHVTTQFTKLKITTSGTDSSVIDFWGIDNITLTIPPIISVNPQNIIIFCWPHYGSCVYPITIYNEGLSQLDFEISVSHIYPVKHDEIILSTVSDPQFSKSSIPTNGGEPVESAGDDNVILHYDGPNHDAIGLTAGGTFSLAARFPSSMVSPHAGKMLKSVDVYIHDAPQVSILKVWNAGTSNSPGNLIFEKSFTPNANSWNTVNLDQTLYIDGNDLWVGYQVTHPTGKFPCGVDEGPANPNGDWVSIDGLVWEHLAGFGLNYNWNIRAKIQGRPYLNVQPDSGSIPPGSSMQVDAILRVDENSWYYEGNIIITSNDPQQPQVIVPFLYEYINSVEELNDESKLNLYPIPSRSYLYIELLYPFEGLRMVDGLGQIVRSLNVEGKSEIKLELQHLPAGIYFLLAEAKDGKVYTRKIVISR